MRNNTFVSLYTHRPSFLYQVFCAWICFCFFRFWLWTKFVTRHPSYTGSSSGSTCPTTSSPGYMDRANPWRPKHSWYRIDTLSATIVHHLLYNYFITIASYTNTSMLAYARIELGVISHNSLTSPERKEPGVVTFAAISPAMVKASTLHDYESLTRERI